MSSFSLSPIKLYLFAKYNYIPNSYKKQTPSLKLMYLVSFPVGFISYLLASDCIIFGNNFIMKSLFPNKNI